MAGLVVGRIEQDRRGYYHLRDGNTEVICGSRVDCSRTMLKPFGRLSFRQDDKGRSVSADGHGGMRRIRLSAKKDTRGGGIGCRALRLLRERFSLAGMQILAGTPPRVWAFA